jgi:hypothetical protein
MDRVISGLILTVITLMGITIFSALFSTSAFQGTSEPWKSIAVSQSRTLIDGILLLAAVSGVGVLAYLSSLAR